jgi:hypothetical protein
MQSQRREGKDQIAMTFHAIRTATVSLAAAAALTLSAASALAQQTYPNNYPNGAQQQNNNPNAQQQNNSPNRDQRDADRDRLNNSSASDMSVPDNDARHNWTNDQIITATVHQAWVLSGQNEANFFEIVKELAEISAHNRNLSLPDDPVAGRRAGAYIKEQARLDHDQLLYVIVDKSVRMTGRPLNPEAAQSR